jgi:hypothetical protein
MLHLSLINKSHILTWIHKLKLLMTTSFMGLFIPSAKTSKNSPDELYAMIEKIRKIDKNVYYTPMFNLITHSFPKANLDLYKEELKFYSKNLLKLRHRISTIYHYQEMSISRFFTRGGCYIDINEEINYLLDDAENFIRVYNEARDYIDKESEDLEMVYKTNCRLLQDFYVNLISFLNKLSNV